MATADRSRASAQLQCEHYPQNCHLMFGSGTPYGSQSSVQKLSGKLEAGDPCPHCDGELVLIES